MILAIDVYYFENKAKSVGLIFNDWNDDQAKETVFTYVENVEEYESGAFYKRELPCILQLLEKIDLTTIQIIIISAVGIDIIEAAEQIQHMSGTFRVPKLLKLLDQETKAL